MTSPTPDTQDAVERVIAGLDELAAPDNKNLPAGTRDDRCRRQGMVFAYGIAAKMVRTLLSTPNPSETRHDD